MTRRALAVLVAGLLGALACLVTVAPPLATASCATDRPPRSPAAFTGVVLSTRSKGRVAEIRTDAGETVTVRGTPGTLFSSETSVDRSYEVGGRYEFHPVNRSSPYEDNACTATRLLSRGPLPASPAPSGWSPAETALGAAIVVAGLAALGLLLRRRRVRRARGARP
jgi:hypothetical protein